MLVILDVDRVLLTLDALVVVAFAFILVVLIFRLRLSFLWWLLVGLALRSSLLIWLVMVSGGGVNDLSVMRWLS